MFIFKFPPSSISLCGNMKSRKMTDQVTKESDKCEHMSPKCSLGTIKVLTEGDNKLRSTVHIKLKAMPLGILVNIVFQSPNINS